MIDTRVDHVVGNMHLDLNGKPSTEVASESGDTKCTGIGKHVYD